MNRNTPSRREILARTAGGFGAVALAQLLQLDGVAEEAASRTHFAPKAKRVIQLFMNGGASQMDLFDYKPELVKRHGQAFDPGANDHVEAPTSVPGMVMGPVFPFAQHGACGRWLSSLTPKLADHVDEIAFLMAMTTRSNVHGPSSYMMNTGFLLPGFPCLGAWVSFALGRIVDNLPTFVVLPDARGFPYNQKGNFSAGFLPVTHQGTIVESAAPDPFPFLRAPSNAATFTAEATRQGHGLLQEMNREFARANPGDSRLEARLDAYELAAKLQLSAPEAFEIQSETQETLEAYGLERKETADFGKRCLLARRLIERGSRFVQVWSGAGGPTNNWDNHSSIVKELPPMTTATDQPIAALLTDLRERGLLEDTLVLWNTEFGRMPFTQGAEGRDHNGGTFVGWLAGAGVKGGVAYGESDPWSWKASLSPTTVYDFHATVLHILGLDHERVTFRHNGADRRLTDVHGHVIHEVLT